MPGRRGRRTPVPAQGRGDGGKRGSTELSSFPGSCARSGNGPRVEPRVDGGSLDATKLIPETKGDLCSPVRKNVSGEIMQAKHIVYHKLSSLFGQENEVSRLGQPVNNSKNDSVTIGCRKSRGNKLPVVLLYRGPPEMLQQESKGACDTGIAGQPRRVTILQNLGAKISWDKETVSGAGGSRTLSVSLFYLILYCPGDSFHVAGGEENLFRLDRGTLDWN